MILYTLYIEGFAIGRGCVPSAQDMMFNYDQGNCIK